ncbi:MAG: S-layer homology domain-containing protein [Clostridia bacterium]|nr:S-layer homology domain-containing protein [Clostridia bacterium]
MKKFTALIAVLSILGFAFSTNAQNISDWAEKDVTAAIEAGIVPDEIKDADMTKKITRGEFAAVSLRAYENISKSKAEMPAENPFSDTDNADILKAYNTGIIKGISESKFAPEEFLNREQAATMLARIYEKVMTGKISDTFSYEYGEKLFDDDDAISDWAKPAVYFMSDNKIINGIGDNLFAPKNITDEQAESGYANTTIEQAVVLALRLVSADIYKDKLGGDIDPYSLAQSEISKDENAYTVAFIGGSLTEGGAHWITETTKMLGEKMPDKKIEYINSGKGGTGSSYGAARFMHDVGVFNPDMVFIEFAVNDNGASEANSKIYMESMVRMCARLESKPVVIFLYAPFPYEKDSADYEKWEQGVKWKEQIANYYGLKSINIYDYMQEDYEKIKDEKGYETFTDYLKTMYNKSGAGFDVHGGYTKYAEAILKAFNEDFEGCLTRPEEKPVFCKENKTIVDAVYNYIDVNDPRMKYSGEWSVYTADNPFTDTSSGVSINSKHYYFPYFEHGIRQSLKQASAFGFMTKAEAFCINFPSASAGSGAKVYIDMVEKGSVSCYSSIHGMNYQGGFVSLPNDGKEHKVIVVVNEATDSNYVFRFGNVIERFTK